MPRSQASGGQGRPFEFTDVLTVVTFAAAMIVCLLDAIFGLKLYWLIFVALVVDCLGAPWCMRHREKRLEEQEATARAEEAQHLDRH
jgi:Flp pilus assembly protein TadB